MLSAILAISRAVASTPMRNPRKSRETVSSLSDSLPRHVSFDSSIRAVIFPAAWLERLGQDGGHHRLQTAKPMPCSPARAASIAAFCAGKIRLAGDFGNHPGDLADLRGCGLDKDSGRRSELLRVAAVTFGWVAGLGATGSASDVFSGRSRRSGAVLYLRWSFLRRRRFAASSRRRTGGVSAKPCVMVQATTAASRMPQSKVAARVSFASDTSASAGGVLQFHRIRRRGEAGVGQVRPHDCRNDPNNAKLKTPKIARTTTTNPNARASVTPMHTFCTFCLVLQRFSYRRRGSDRTPAGRHRSTRTASASGRDRPAGRPRASASASPTTARFGIAKLFFDLGVATGKPGRSIAISISAWRSLSWHSSWTAPAAAAPHEPSRPA